MHLEWDWDSHKRSGNYLLYLFLSQWPGNTNAAAIRDYNDIRMENRVCRLIDGLGGGVLICTVDDGHVLLIREPPESQCNQHVITLLKSCYKVGDYLKKAGSKCISLNERNVIISSTS